MRLEEYSIPAAAKYIILVVNSHDRKHGYYNNRTGFCLLMNPIFREGGEERQRQISSVLRAGFLLEVL